MLNRNRFLLGQYRPGTGILYRLDARTKIIMVLAVMIIALVSTNLVLYGALVLFLLGLLLSCRLSWRLLLGNLKPVAWFIAFTALFHLLFSGKSDPVIVFSVGPVTVSQTGAVMAVTFSARILIFVLATFVLSLTTSPLSLSEAIVCLLRPLHWARVPIYDLGMILFIALRFIPVLLNEVDTIRKAQFIRGVTLTGPLRTRLKRSVALVLPVFFSALRRADDLSVAIETRGYRSGQPRSSLHPLRFRTLDIVVLAAVSAAVVLIVTGSEFLW